jgi:hypothetical protein
MSYFSRGALYVSSDSGTNWTLVNPLDADWRSLACSADGTKIMAGSVLYANEGPVYFSSDSGATWHPMAAPQLYWNGLAGSAAGDYWVAVSFASRSGSYVFPPLPVLTIARSAEDVAISWLLDDTFALQHCTNLLTGPWQTLTNLPSVTNGLNSIQLPTSLANEFFRLIKVPSFVDSLKSR